MPEQQMQNTMQQVPTEIIPPKQRVYLFGAVLLVLLLLIGGAWFFLTQHQQSSVPPQTNVAPSPVSGIENAKVIDLSPSVASSEKTVLVIELSDSSFEKVIIATSLAAGYVKTLPEGDRLISEKPLSQ